MGGREGEFEAMCGLLRDPGSGLFGDVRGMIVEDQLDRRVGRIGGVEELEKFDEFATAMTVLDQGMDVTGEQIDAGHQGHRAVAFIFKLACEGGCSAGLGRPIRSGGCDRLDARLLVVGDDRHRFARRLFRRGGRLLEDFHLAIDAQDLGHLFGKVGIALFQVVAHFVRLDFLLVEDFAHRALRQMCQARMSLRRSVLAGMAGEQPGRPQFMGITQVLGLPARQRHQPGFGLERDRRFASGTRPIVERRDRAFDHARARRSGGLSDGEARAPDQPQKTKDPPDRPAIFAPARPDLPVRFAIALSNSTRPYPLLRATIQSPAATLP